MFFNFHLNYRIRKLEDVNYTLDLIPTESEYILSNLPEMVPNVTPEQRKSLEKQ